MHQIHTVVYQVYALSTIGSVSLRAILTGKVRVRSLHDAEPPYSVKERSPKTVVCGND